jgi:hypothetical protein
MEKGPREEASHMHVVLYPFFSQQNKRTDRFLLQSDSGVKLYAYMADRMVEEGWQTSLVLPAPRQCADTIATNARVRRIPYLIATNNLIRRLQHCPDWYKTMLHDADLLLTQHETLAYVVRCILPNVRIGTEVGMRLDTAWPQTEEMMRLSRRSSDFLHCNSRTLAEETTHKCTTVWPFAYHDDIPLNTASDAERSIDVLFNSRCSSTDYSNHKLFLAAMLLQDWRVCMTDPTNYLRTTSDELPSHIAVPRSPLNRNDYLQTLRRSRVVVGLTDNGYGGYAFREAIAAGCVPVALNCTSYRELLGDDWPYYCSGNSGSLRAAVSDALTHGMPEQSHHLCSEMSRCSYSAAWRTAKEFIDALLP